MIEKNIFVYKLFLSLNTRDFSLFFYVKTETPLKRPLPLSQQTPFENGDPVKSPPLVGC